MYAVGDVTSVGTPKAGVFSEGQAGVVADAIVARHRGGDAATYAGRGICYIEFGDGQVGKVEAIFVAGQTPTGDVRGPVARAHRRQGRVRRRAHPPLVRPRVDERLTGPAVLVGHNGSRPGR